MITYSEAQQSRALRISGVCSTSPQFGDLLNDATRLLIKRGNWTSTIQFCNACIYGDIVTWNRYVNTVLALDVCGRPTQPVNMWHDWLPPGDEEARSRFRHWRHHGRGNLDTVQLGTSPVFNQINPNEPQFIQVFPTDPQDNGKTITILGLDQNSQPVLSPRTDGTIQPGEKIIIQTPYSVSKNVFTRVDRVVKDQTRGRLNVFQFDAVLSILLPLAIYEPNETAPQYQQTRVPRFHNARGCGCSPNMVRAMVKIQFVEVQNPDDLVQIDNLDALALAMQSVKHSDAYDHAGAEAAMARAVRDLNYQLRDKFPLEQTTVSFRPFGTANLDRLHLGMR